VICRIFNVDKSSYYHLKKVGCIIQKVDAKLNELIFLMIK
jgi:hypothetical protein